MKKKELSPFERDTIKRIEEDTKFGDVFFEELMERPLSVQISMLRKLNGVSQVQLASRLHVKQSFLSKLEKEGSDHLVGIYAKVAEMLHSKLAIIPNGAKIVFPKGQSKLPHAV